MTSARIAQLLHETIAKCALQDRNTSLGTHAQNPTESGNYQIRQETEVEGACDYVLLELASQF